MKKLLRLICTIVVLSTIFIYMETYSYAAGRLVDIPVPENSTGHADSTLSEKEEQAKKYEEKQKENKANENNASNIVEKNNTEDKQNNLEENKENEKMKKTLIKKQKAMKVLKTTHLKIRKVNLL